MEANFIEKFKEVLESESLEVNLEDKFREYEEWNSLAFLSLIAMIDEEYDVIIEGKEFKTLETVADIVNAIKQKSGK